ncbi:MAG: hypothetical protein ACI9LO_002915 [Planctomycetota bacterium]|jgi:hypothetical protein
MTLSDELQTYGLYIRGRAELTGPELESYADFSGYQSILLIGNTGSSYWPNFSASAEYSDGGDDPLDRWSRRVAAKICTVHPMAVVFPFEGPPYYPFQQWAKRAEALTQSPLGIMMHPQFGLWHSYRFALLDKAALAIDPRLAQGSPCIDCKDQPCLHTCPVEAYSISGYDVDGCAGYLAETPAASCLQNGCEARNACPVAIEFKYQPEQSRFHLRAFIDARPV